MNNSKYLTFCLIPFLAVLFLSCQSRQNQGQSDFATVALSIDNPGKHPGGQASTSGDIGTALIIAVPDTVSAINNFTYLTDYYARDLLDLTDGSVELSLPLNVHLCIIEVTFTENLSLSEIVSNNPTALTIGISELLTISGDTDTLEISIPLSSTLSSTASITTFAFPVSLNSELSSDITGTIDETKKTITATVPYGTDLTTLVAAFTTTGSSITVEDTTQESGTTSNDFSNAVTFTVTAEDSSTQAYTVTVSVAANDANTITAFSFEAVNNSELSSDVTGTIDETNKTVSLAVPYGTSVTSLIPTISISGYSISPASGVATDFSSPVTYTVTAADGTTQDYLVTVTITVSAHKAITSFKFLASENTALSVDVNGSIDETAKTIGLTVPNGTIVTALKPTITISGSSVSSENGTATNFANDVIYTATAEDGTTQNYTVTVTITSSSSVSNCVMGTAKTGNCKLSSS